MRVERYASAFPHAVRAPNCHRRRVDEGMPLIGVMRLKALYRVRCNLFHGTESVFGAEDREIVNSATGAYSFRSFDSSC
jgi:hypothetical protein